MMLHKKYNPGLIEPELRKRWSEKGTNQFDLNSPAPVFSIDTPPATVSGRLHLGHLYSYSHPDFIARFWRMNGHNVFYPMGYDDNGLPTGKLVEKQLGKRATDIGREAFIEKCLSLSEEAEGEYQEIWQRLGLSIDWRFTYRTIAARSRRISQHSFLDLYRQGRVYRKEAPTIWCPECGTAIAQAELEDIQRQSEFMTLRFRLLPSGKPQEIPEGSIEEPVLIATTRPELLPACVAIFINPEDERCTQLVGRTVEVPLFNQHVQILADRLVDPDKGTGIVMCCTFGDQTDVLWWQHYNLPLIEAIAPDGTMTTQAGEFSNMSTQEARRRIVDRLVENGLLVEQTPLLQSVRVHERCDTPVEYISTQQWFIRILDEKHDLLAAGEKVNWFPAHMANRYQAWVENLNWDWCISRQRYFGVAFPVWYCNHCGEITLASEDQLPVDPLVDHPGNSCWHCGSHSFSPETDVMDTWATSALTPQIVGGWLDNPHLYEKVHPFTLRPQAHEIIRTWTFYTIAKSKYHFNAIPWRDAFISGWGIAGEGHGKISKSRGGGAMPPLEMIEKYSADAVRYWAASTGPGKDAIISEEKIQTGLKLVNKIWNVARFSSRFLEANPPPKATRESEFSPADRWILSRTQELVRLVTSHYKNYDYAAAKAETETFLWTFTDNYLEMVKQRLYDQESPLHEGARFTLYQVFLTLLKLFAPILPFVTEYIYLELFAPGDNDNDHTAPASIHTSAWPKPETSWIDEQAEKTGEALLEIARQVRRYKSEQNLSLGTALSLVKLAVDRRDLAAELQAASPDIKSITRAVSLEIEHNNPKSQVSATSNGITLLEIVP